MSADPGVDAFPLGVRVLGRERFVTLFEGLHGPQRVGVAFRARDDDLVRGLGPLAQLGTQGEQFAPGPAWPQT
jgi:hypothetical protein